MPRGTGQPHKEQTEYTEDTRDGEDGVEHKDEEDDRHRGARLMKKEHDVN